MVSRPHLNAIALLPGQKMITSIYYSVSHLYENIKFLAHLQAF